MKIRSVILVALMAIGVFAAATSRAAELVMFESTSCTWCETWHEEIGPVYGKTDEGKAAPLRRVDIFDDRPGDLADIPGIVYTPTFVLIRSGREVGRITGYPGEEFFWWQLDTILAKTDPSAAACAQPPSTAVKSATAIRNTKVAEC